MGRRDIKYGANAEAISNGITRVCVNSKGLPLAARQVGGASRDGIQSSDICTAYPRAQMRCLVTGPESKRVELHSDPDIGATGGCGEGLWRVGHLFGYATL